jgi:hypothetical protein
LITKEQAAMSVVRLKAFLLVGAAIAFLPLTAHSRSKAAINVDSRDLAVKGFDVVAYATSGAAVPGRPEFEHRWNDVIWRFASATHRDQFERDPARYAPQFGGYCAWAVSRGYTADIDPEAWKIVDGKLYLNYSKRVQKMWEEDVAGNIAKAVANWPGVLSK